ncbi:hypothetical protein BS47DRAFT_1319737 [Hydnum rufescens UP504]|uniref:Actin-like ATPase domain-containing protein n=1 Tax=Hydnum rufescens UP504 TaxID=1448309 RepID=A0A9P6AQU2_9AGAM|nr:hypothetical protein BS47DRAFT_1319737 [Hydnum rufescens UP504]
MDFGAAYSSASYVASTCEEVHQILAWPGSNTPVSKIPTCLVYDALGHIRAWGVEAKDMGLRRGWVRSEWFKLWLDPSSAPRTVLASRSFQLPKNVVDVVADYLSCMWMHTKDQISRENGPCSLSNAEIYLTFPSSWSLRASLLLREAAIKAGLVVQDSDSEDTYERLHIIPETEASVIHSPLTAFKFRRDQVLTICDAGGATVDLATYSVLRASGVPEIAEVIPRSGSYSGSLFLDLRFRELVRARLATHPVHLDEASLAHFVRSFSESDKLAYKGPEDDTKLFRFRCLYAEDSHDPAVGLEHGELVIPGDVLRHRVFDPVIEQVSLLPCPAKFRHTVILICSIQVLHTTASHVETSNVRLDVLLLVGGFSRNEYLFERIKDRFASNIAVIRPAEGDFASYGGGARLRIGSLVSSVVPPHNVFRRVTLPAEQEDMALRPAYITGVPGSLLCENRVEYIVRRGSRVMKGVRSELRVRKFCSSRADRTFELVLYTSDGDQTRRYFDEEQGEELCRCCVDLGTYPGFLERAETSLFGSFYTDFVLGFEMDSAEIQCVLLYKGAKCGSVTCHPLSHRTDAHPWRGS